MGRFYHNSDGLDVMCTKCVRRTDIYISKSNFGRICDDVGITSSKFVTNKRKMNEGLIIIFFL